MSYPHNYMKTKNNRLLFLLLSCCLSWLICTGSCQAADRVALVIGNSDYAASPLKNPVNDANDIAAQLKRLEFEVMLRTNINQRQTDEAVDTFYRKLQQAEVGLFYYAGHGMQIEGYNYLIPVGAQISSASDVKYRAVHAGRVLGKMEDAGNKLNIVILDACRDNPFRSYFRSAQKGLAFMNAPDGTLIAYATAPGSVAADGGGRNGLYTKHLLTNIKRDDLTVMELFNQTSLDVKRATGGKQSPWMYTTGMEQFYLAGGSFLVEEEPQTGKEPQQKTGTLRVTSMPEGATLYLDDRQSGTTPVTLAGLATGRVTIRVDLDGYRPEKRRVEVRAGSRSTVSFALSPLARKGWLTISPEPADAQVRILNIGPAYSPGMELDPGRYQVEVTAQGYERQLRWVSLTAGESVDIDITLERISGGTYGATYTDPTTNMEFVWVEGGCFQMGQTALEKDQLIKERGQEKYDKYYKRELPRHEVCVDGLYMGAHEVTLGQWRQFIEATGYRTDAEKDTGEEGCYVFKDSKWGWKDGYYWDKVNFSQSSDHPVVCVSFNDVKRYVAWQNQVSGKAYRLPTEAEWEYAARGGTTSVRFWGDEVDSSGCSYANVADKENGWKYSFPCDDGFKYTAPVGTYKPNQYGLYDMLGNVWEWTGDWYGEEYYKKSPRSNPSGPSSGSNRVNRGGSWSDDPRSVRAALRLRGRPAIRGDFLGFRLVLPVQR